MTPKPARHRIPQIIGDIASLKHCCKTADDVADLKALLPLLLEDDPEESEAAKRAILEILSGPPGNIHPM